MLRGSQRAIRRIEGHGTIRIVHRVPVASALEAVRNGEIRASPRVKARKECFDAWPKGADHSVSEKPKLEVARELLCADYDTT